MSIEKRLTVTEIQRFCMHDGPGIRTTVFFKGCPLRCAWCHNPETQKGQAELLFYPNKCIGCRACASCPQDAHDFDQACIHTLHRKKCTVCGACVSSCPTGALEKSGRPMTVSEILSEVKRDLAFYGDCGGVTLSGGEPFFQGAEILELLKQCRREGISTAAETCGYAKRDLLVGAVPCTDLFLWDIKDTTEERHKTYTGVSLSPILENLRAVDGAGGKTRLRCILVNGVNTERAHYEAVADLAASLTCCEGVEFLSYHAYAGTKSVFLGGLDSGRRDWIPAEEQMNEAKTVIRSRGISLFDSKSAK